MPGVLESLYSEGVLSADDAAFAGMSTGKPVLESAEDGADDYTEAAAVLNESGDKEGHALLSEAALEKREDEIYEPPPWPNAKVNLIKMLGVDAETVFGTLPEARIRAAVSYIATDETFQEAWEENLGAPHAIAELIFQADKLARTEPVPDQFGATHVGPSDSLVGRAQALREIKAMNEERPPYSGDRFLQTGWYDPLWQAMLKERFEIAHGAEPIVGTGGRTV